MNEQNPDTSRGMTPNVRPQQTTAVARRLQPITQQLQTNLTNATEFAVGAFNSTNEGSSVLAALNVAQGIAELRELFDQPEIKERIIALQDKAIGFRTDKDPTRKAKGRDGQPDYFPTPYSWEIVRDCSIEATLRGLQLAGNQFNIISGRMYATKEGYENLIRSLKRISEFSPTIGVPKPAGEGVLVDCEASWVNHTSPQNLKATIPVKKFGTDSIEMVIGKATRKFLKRCYEKMTGNAPSDGDASDAIEVEAEVQPQAQPSPAPSFSKARKTHQEAAQATEATPTTPTPPTTPQPPAQATVNPLALTERQQQFKDLCCGEVNGLAIDFDDAMSWLKTTGRWPQSDDATGWSDVPDSIITALTEAPNDVKKLFKIFGKAVAK
jgi:hypothetical protein